MLPDELLDNDTLIADFCEYALELLNSAAVENLTSFLQHRLKMNDIKLNVYKKSISRIQEEQQGLSDLIKSLKLLVKQ
jgi:hypothetical protein